jgi:hypothetical protein
MPKPIVKFSRAERGRLLVAISFVGGGLSAANCRDGIAGVIDDL